MNTPSLSTPFWSPPDVEASLHATIDHLQNRGVLAYPTETVYGLGADAANPAAVGLLGGDAAAGGTPLEAFRAALARQPDLAGQWQGAMSEERSVPRSATTVELGERKVEIGWSLQALRRGGSAGGYLVLLADTTDLSRRESEARFAAGLAQLGELSAVVGRRVGPPDFRDRRLDDAFNGDFHGLTPCVWPSI